MSITDLDETVSSPGEATREFYRWQGRQQERERIIAILNGKHCTMNCPKHPGECDVFIHNLGRYLELIEGGN